MADASAVNSALARTAHQAARIAVPAAWSGVEIVARERADDSRPFLPYLRARTAGDGPRSWKPDVPGAGLRRGGDLWRLLCQYASAGPGARLHAPRTRPQDDHGVREAPQHSLFRPF